MRAPGQLVEHGRAITIVARLAENLAVHHDGRVGAEDDDIVDGCPFGASARLRAFDESLQRRGGLFPREPLDVRWRRFARPSLPWPRSGLPRPPSLARTARRCRCSASMT